jgi:predicted lipoprotein with Yx(FWY)xxD motif
MKSHTRSDSSLNIKSANAVFGWRLENSLGRPGRTAIAALTLALAPFAGHSDETIPKAVNTQLPYPAVVSLVQESGGYTFRQNETNAPLYINERDSPGKSVCDDACESQWFPLIAKANEKPLGEWTAFKREDGRWQWAFKKRPVYTHIHDSPDQPNGDGMEGVWHLMPHFATGL